MTTSLIWIYRSSHLGLTGGSSPFEGLTKLLPNDPFSIITELLSLACDLLKIMNKIFSFPKQQQSILKKFVKKGPGEQK